MYRGQRHVWFRLLAGPGVEEAFRLVEEHIELQARLQQLGFLPPSAEIDGVYGAATRTAIATWQRLNNRPETGLLSNADAALLRSRGAAVPPPVAARPTPPPAGTHVTYSSGAWRAFSGTSSGGRRVCGAKLEGEDRAFMLKWFDGDDDLTVHIFKQGWAISSGTIVDVMVQIDRVEPWTASGSGNGSMVAFSVPGGDAAKFLGELNAGRALHIAFPSGNEAEWDGNLSGNNGVLVVVAQCIRAFESAERLGPIVNRFASANPTFHGCD